jgi:hypothetical protein
MDGNMIDLDGARAGYAMAQIKEKTGMSRENAVALLAAFRVASE